MNLPYQNLLDISAAISSFVVVLLFLFLFESRYQKKAYLCSLIPFLCIWFGVNLSILFIYGLDVLGNVSLFSATIPSLLYFWIVAKDRRGKFFFTFCLVDTITIWVPAAELSTVFANALENMINAVMDLPRDKRVIICKCISSPRLMLEFANPCSDNVIIGRNGLPVIDSDSHGIGTRSIKAFSEKYGAVCSFRVENGWFKLQLAL